ATGESWRKVHLWDAITGKHRETLVFPAHREPFQKPLDRWAVASTPDGRFLFTSNTGNLWFWDVIARREVAPFEEDESEWSVAGTGNLAFSPDGRLLAWFDQGWRLRLYEVCSGQIIHRFNEAALSVAFAPSSWQLATACGADASILVWDLRSLFLAQSPSPTTAPALWDALADV